MFKKEQKDWSNNKFKVENVDYDINTVIDDALTNTEFTANVIFEGYKYYLPGGVTYIDSDELNDILYCNGNYYYLYIDAINYYYQNKILFSLLLHYHLMNLPL